MSVITTSYAAKGVLITGGSGFIGRHLARRLIDVSARVTVFGPGPACVSGAEHCIGDVSDQAAVAELAARRFDYIFHLAGYSGQAPGYADHEQSLTTNCLGLLNVLDAVRTRSDATVLCFPSSRLVYGRTMCLPVDESHATAPLSLYGIHKRAGEEYCKYYGERWGIRSVVVRLSNPYGSHAIAAHNRYNVANWMIDEALLGRAISVFGQGEQLRDYIYIDDAVEAMLGAAADPRAHGRTYNVGSGEGVALASFVRTAIAAAGAGSMRCEAWPADLLQVETGDYVADIRRMRDELGWRPRIGLGEGIARTVEAQRALVPQRRMRRERSQLLAADNERKQDLEAAA